MDITLVINPGSTSKKYAFYQDGNEVLSVLFEKSGNEHGLCVEINRTRKQCKEVTKVKYKKALNEVISIAKKEGVIEKLKDVTRLGIRIVAPSTFFSSHRVIDFSYIKKLRTFAKIAPLHVPSLLEEIDSVKKLLKDVRCIGISDSAFHNTLPTAARWYGLPKKLAQRHDLYRFGYHGLSVASVARQVGNKNGNLPKKMIICHIGGGVSVTAVMDGKSIDTTMGFGPTSGLMMGTRSGDIDPSALIHLFRSVKDPEILEEIVSKNGGLNGILGSGDLRITMERRRKGDRDAQIAFDMYIRGIRKAIGAMSVVLNGIDALVLTGTAVERNPIVRKHIASNFEYLGLTIDFKKNEELAGKTGIFSKESSAVTAQVVHTDEMAEIAQIARIL